MANKWALILGAYADVGSAMAEALAAEGYHLQLAGRSQERLARLAKDLEIKYGIQTAIFSLDAMDFQPIQTTLNQLSPLPDVAVQVFGYLGDQEKGMTETEEALRILHTNFTGAVLCLNTLMVRMEQRGSGIIAGVSSVAGERGRMSNFLYGSAKAGLSTYLAGLRNRGYHSGVRVITLKPGFIQTAMTAHLTLPPALTATPQEVARDFMKALRGKQHVVFTKWMWKYIMWIIRQIPEGMFIRKKL